MPVCVIDPEVAAIETVDCPAGVVGVGFVSSSPQPAMNPAIITNAIIMHSMRGHAALLRRPASEINGSRNAETTPAVVKFRRIGFRAAVPLDV